MLTFAGPASLPGEHCIYVHRITTNLPIKQTRFTAAYRQPIQFGLACYRLSRLPLVFHQSDSRRSFNKPGLLVQTRWRRFNSDSCSLLHSRRPELLHRGMGTAVEKAGGWSLLRGGFSLSGMHSRGVWESDLQGYEHVNRQLACALRPVLFPTLRQIALARTAVAVVFLFLGSMKKQNKTKNCHVSLALNF